MGRSPTGEQPLTAASPVGLAPHAPLTVADAAGRLSYLAYRAGAVVAQALPPALGEPAARLAGRAAARVMGARAAMVARHQARVAGTVHAPPGAVAQVFDSYARYWYEMFRLPADVRRGRIDAHFSLDGYEHIERALGAGRGAVIALPHLGGWEFAAAWIANRGHRVLAVVEPVEPPELFEWFASVRRALGMEIVPLGPDVATTVLRSLRDNRLACLVSDRDLTGDGVPVPFFGETTTLPAGPATLALRTGAALLPAAVYFRPGRGHHGVIRPPVPIARAGRLRDDVVRITTQLAQAFEDLIRAAPEQWHLMQPNWPSDRGDRAGVPACG